MEDLQALVILRTLVNGVDPESGDLLKSDSMLQRPQTVRALVAAVSALERIERMGRKRSLMSGKAMAPWTVREDNRLLEGFDAGRSPRELAAEHERSPKAIKARLAKLGRQGRAG